MQGGVYEFQFGCMCFACKLLLSFGAGSETHAWSCVMSDLYTFL